jgi:hypothetical protein
MCSQIPTIGFGAAVFGIVLILRMPTAEAKQCNAAMPIRPQGHWTYRLIDGRKCWYEGESSFPKALLQWPEQAHSLSAFGKVEPPKEDSPPVGQTVMPQAEPNNQLAPASFEARWEALGTPLRN